MVSQEVVTGGPASAEADTGSERVSLIVGGMTCASCVRHVEDALGDTGGVTSASVNLASGRATVEYIPGETAISDLRYAVEDAGYSFEGVSGDEYREPAGAEEQKELKRKAIFSLAIAGVIMAMMAASSMTGSSALSRSRDMSSGGV